MRSDDVLSVVLDVVEKIDAEAKKMKKRIPLLVGYGIVVLERIADKIIWFEKTLSNSRPGSVKRTSKQGPKHRSKR